MIAVGMRVLLHHGGSYYSTGRVRDVDGRVCLVEVWRTGARVWASVLQVTPLPADLPAEPTTVDPWPVYACIAVVVGAWAVIGGLLWGL